MAKLDRNLVISKNRGLYKWHYQKGVGLQKGITTEGSTLFTYICISSGWFKQNV